MEGLRGRASTAGPVEPDPCKSDGPASDSRGEWSAFRDEASEVHLALAVSPAGRPCPPSAAPPAEPPAARRDSVLRAAAKDCPLPPAVVPPIARGVVQGVAHRVDRRVDQCVDPEPVQRVARALPVPPDEVSGAVSVYSAPDAKARAGAGLAVSLPPGLTLPKKALPPQDGLEYVLE
jgi:hypothetical protein